MTYKNIKCQIANDTWTYPHHHDCAHAHLNDALSGVDLRRNDDGLEYRLSLYNSASYFSADQQRRRYKN